MAYWFHLQFGVEPAVLGAIFFGANLLAAVSSLLARRGSPPGSGSSARWSSPTCRRTSC